MWYKGFTHYHTSFNYPDQSKVSPEELACDLKKLDVSFAFCAGDHGDALGNNYWGLDVREFEAYRNACLSQNNRDSFVFIPTPETHLMFPPFTERHEHHSCIPIVDYLPELDLPESRALAASYTKNVSRFIAELHEHDAPLTLNHPYLSINSCFSAPDPRSAAVLQQCDYLELFTIDHPDFFRSDFDLYLKLLSRRDSSMMACSAGVDNALTPQRLPSAENRIIPCTYLQTADGLSMKSIMDAWKERRSYAVYGSLYLEAITPVPSTAIIEAVKNPSLALTVKNLSDRKITEMEIYRNGLKIYAEPIKQKNKYRINWRDEAPVNGENHYVIHIAGENEHLVTSPINYFC
ncbi:MAG: hypothetical protein PHV82_08830 [Victivallaceae bacterium]|nr:hypothetical protein [Victivallaceae bacterium]